MPAPSFDDHAGLDRRSNVRPAASNSYIGVLELAGAEIAVVNPLGDYAAAMSGLRSPARAAQPRFGRTVIPTGLLVVTAPALSVARAVKTWLPGGTFLHVKEYGALVS
jgi:hypothetical protein